MTEIKEINQLGYAGTLTKSHKLPVQIDDGTILQANVGDITEIAVNEVIESVNDYVADAMDVINNITNEPTGFTNNENIVVTYNSSTRKITLTGIFEAYYKGALIHELTNEWESAAHPATLDKTYFFYYCDDGFVISDQIWDFNCLQIAVVQYFTAQQIALREVHGFQQWQTHKELHEVIGTYLIAGGDLSDFTLSSTTATVKRPVVSSARIQDEDLPSVLDALTSKQYTIRYLVGSVAVRTFETDRGDFIKLSTTTPQFNEFTGGAWTFTNMSNNNYAAVFLVAIPTTDDTTSKKYRFMWTQPQQQSATLATIQALTPNSLNHGSDAALLPEYVFIGKIIIQCTSGGNNWQIISVEKLTGTRINQVTTNLGGAITSVTHDNNFAGSGTSLSPLTLASLTTYENNADAFAALGSGRLYIRSGHGLDISVTV